MPKQFNYCKTYDSGEKMELINVGLLSGEISYDEKVDMLITTAMMAGYEDPAVLEVKLFHVGYTPIIVAKKGGKEHFAILEINIIEWLYDELSESASTKIAFAEVGSDEWYDFDIDTRPVHEHFTKIKKPHKP